MGKGQSSATIIDIAKRAGVSFKTVSRVLNEHPTVGAALRERVIQAMADLDYRPNVAARSLPGRRGYAIAFIISAESMMHSGDEDWYLAPFCADLQFGAFKACQDVGYRFVLQSVDIESPTLTQDLGRQLAQEGVDGVVLSPPTADSARLLDALDACGITYVRIAPGTQPDRSASVAIDEYGGGFAMTKHLLSLGHRHIGFIAGPDDHIAARERMTGYCDALAQVEGAGPAMVMPGDFTFLSGMESAQKLLACEQPPTAIFAANDDMAAGALAAANHSGIRVPTQLSIAGFDDSTTARLAWPPLTTIRQPIAAMTAAAIRYLIAAAGTGGSAPPVERIEIPFTLVSRSSAGPCPSSSDGKLRSE